MIIGLDAGFSFSLCCVGVLLIGFCFSCFPGQLSWCILRECLLISEVGIMGGAGGRKNGG